MFDTFTVHESYPVDTDSIEGRRWVGWWCAMWRRLMRRIIR